MKSKKELLKEMNEELILLINGYLVQGVPIKKQIALLEKMVYFLNRIQK